MSPSAALPGRAFGIMRRHLAALTAAAVWPYLLLVLFLAVAAAVLRPYAPPEGWNAVELWRSLTMAAKLGVLLAYIACVSVPWSLASGGVSVLVYEDCRAREVSARSALDRLRRRLPSLLALSFVVGGPGLFGWFVMVVPGFAVFMFAAFSVPAMMNEEVGVLRALQRSSSLVGDRIGTVAALVAASAGVALVTWVPFDFLVLPLVAGRIANAAMTWVFIALLAPALIVVYGTFVTVLYCDIRRQRGELPAAVAADRHGTGNAA
jgi:hypothetical protein